MSATLGFGPASVDLTWEPMGMSLSITVRCCLDLQLPLQSHHGAFCCPDSHCRLC